MPRENKSRREVLNAIRDIPSLKELLSTHDGHFDHELDLEVTVYGRNYNGKKVGPYVRLLTYEPNEVVMNEGEWGGNTFFVVTQGRFDVLVKTPDGRQVKVAEIEPGTHFGEMSVLAGQPRSATIKAPANASAQVLEIQRPALRLLRKLKDFGDALDRVYRDHARDAAIEDIKAVINLPPELIKELVPIATFRAFSKNHLLFREGAKIDRVYIVKEGWLRRLQPSNPNRTEDFIGKGYTFGVEGILKDGRWPYSATVMSRTEVLEISIRRLRKNIALREALARELSRFAPPPIGSLVSPKPRVREMMLSSQRAIIDTGLVDATNLLVMDMDLCVRCGNCSLACHKTHGQSRLLRRGIHVTRLEKPRPRAIQSVLAPAVCMHCEEPECLTGCPTGAIGRFARGQIDIDPKTCIGCGDCATQCPYNAISMIPRKPDKSAISSGLAAKIKDLLRLAPDSLPPAVDTTEDLVAVKCNLCNNTTINPEGSKGQAYSCEENCPTGALARINPRQYFTEIGAIEGLMMLDQTHATGRNIHRSDPPRRALHILGILLTVLLTAGTIWGLSRYGLGERLVSFLNMRWITGLVGLAGIFVVMTYPVRRQIYRKRAGPLRYWLLIHSYFGIIAGIMLLLHGGTRSGGLLTTALMISFDAVIFTGLLGVALYFIVPRTLTGLEGAPLLIDDLKQRREELQNDIADIASSSPEPIRSIVINKVVPRFMTFGYLLRQYIRRENLDQMLESARKEFEQYTRGLREEKDRKKLERAVESAATLRRVDALVYLHRSLKLWLPPHVATTALMLALMIVHIIQVIYYASR
ncbi:MAG TPA: cyclic nucleotide-binding domain-containing protein [Blastocatellia bacterium]|nr:cyclic nucleotide-binding domain-containing protein [Blastocatellia bacterium]